MTTIDCARSIGFLLAHAGPVIRYRLRKFILCDLSAGEEASLLTQIYELPLFRQLGGYVKPSGYIGSGMHSWDNWGGVRLHETPLQDGETAARLLADYRIPPTHPYVQNFVAVLRDEEALRREFAYIPPEVARFEGRFDGFNSGNSLMALVHTVEAMLGFGDDTPQMLDFQQICLEGFRRILTIQSLADIARFDGQARRKYNYPYIGADAFFPNVYTLTALAHTRAWRSGETVAMLADAINHLNAIMQPENNLHVRLGSGKYFVPYGALIRPIRAFDPDVIDIINYRRTLTHLAMAGVGTRAKVLAQSLIRIQEALDGDGILRMNLDQPHNRRYSPRSIRYPTPYVDARLEADYKDKNALWCDLTFWAVELVHLIQAGDHAA